jgi:hypothetical protein
MRRQDTVKRMLPILRSAEWMVGILWGLSWFEMYLEVFRYHHVALPWWLGLGPPSLAFGAGAQRGGWLRAVLFCSAVCPCVFVMLAVCRRAFRGMAHPAPPEPAFPLGWVAVSVGCGLCIVGLLNQLVRRSAIVVDVTMRTGNGGFVAVGALLAAVGFSVMLARRRGA